MSKLTLENGLLYLQKELNFFLKPYTDMQAFLISAKWTLFTFPSFTKLLVFSKISRFCFKNAVHVLVLKMLFIFCCVTVLLCSLIPVDEQYLIWTLYYLFMYIVCMCKVGAWSMCKTFSFVIITCPDIPKEPKRPGM